MKQRIIIDCDPGVDDAVAIMLALASPEIEVLGITCVAGNVGIERTSSNAARIRALMGREDVPVLRGCEKTLMGTEMRQASVHGVDGLADIGIANDPVSADPGDAVEFLIRTIKENAEGSVTLCAIGPMTNLAVAFQREPTLSARLKALAFMGGAAFGPGNVTPAAEFNIHCDPHAARLVLAQDVPKIMFGLDVTRKIAIDAEALDLLLHCPPNSAGRVAHRLLSAYGRKDPALHDPCVIAHLIDGKLFRSLASSISVECALGDLYGRTRVDPGEDFQVMVEGDKEGFFSLLSDRLGRAMIAGR